MNASVVVYNPNWKEVELILRTLLAAPIIEKIYLIDNSTVKMPSGVHEKTDTPFASDKVVYHFLGKNLGYGAAHNIALKESIAQGTKYHLVVNADIQFQPEILTELANYMDAHPAVGHIMPKVLYPNGDLQYLCKLLPTPLDLWGRRFLPASWMEKRMERFELHKSGYNKVMNVPFLSGCFMFLRTSVLEEIGLFDERYFLYSEDIDLTRRIHQRYQTLFYPDATIVHYHEKASYKDWGVLWKHMISLCKYFNKWGWWCDKERTRVNKETLAQLV